MHRARITHEKNLNTTERFIQRCRTVEVAHFSQGKGAAELRFVCQNRGFEARLVHVNFISRFCWDSNHFRWHNSYQGLLKKIQFPHQKCAQNAHAPDEIFHRLNYIF